MGKVVEEVVVEGKVVEMDRVMDPGMVLDMVRAVELLAEAMGKVVVVVVAEDKVVEMDQVMDLDMFWLWSRWWSSCWRLWTRWWWWWRWWPRRWFW